MYAKYKIEEIIERLAPRAIKVLGLDKWDIEWKVLNSKKVITDHARCFYNTKRKTAKIEVYFDNARGFKCATGSIIHELIHVKFGKLAEGIDLRKVPRKEALEEDFVAKMENLLIEFLDHRKI